MAELPNFVQNLVGFFSFKTKDIRFIMPVIDTFWLEKLKSSSVYGKNFKYLLKCLLGFGQNLENPVIVRKVQSAVLH